MAQCLFCQQDNPAGVDNCEHCGMALPRHEETRQRQRISRFVWFVILLTLFCAFFIVWYGRTPPAIN